MLVVFREGGKEKDHMDMFTSNAFLASVLVQTVPILYAALGGAFTDQANILNIALEGLMLIGAFAAIAVGAITQSALLAVLAAVIAGIVFAAIFGYVSLSLKADYIIVGIGINLLASGLTIFMLSEFYHNQGSYSPDAFPQLWQPQLAKLAAIPVLGALSDQNILFFLLIVCIVVAYYVMYRTRIGLHIRAVGKNPEAAEAAGISPYRIKFLTILISGVLSGLGGAALSMGALQMFVRGMTNGRGFIALVAETFGAATPIGTAVASLVFGAASAASTVLQITGKIAPDVVLMFPYLATLAGMIVVGLRLRDRLRKATKKDRGEAA